VVSAESRPVTAVLAALQGGARSLAEVAERTGLGRDVVDAAITHLVRLGRLEAEELAIGCPSAGCGGCASGTAEGTAGCRSSAPSTRRSGPVLVALRVSRPPG
jgi:bacterioferritin-associated ferredoxin